MDQKAKFIIIGLGGVALISFFLFIQALGSKQSIVRQSEELKKENVTLSGKVGKLESGIRDYENKISLLSADLDKSSQEKTELDKKYELLNKTKNELLERLKKPQAQVPMQAPQPQQPPLEPDTYWAGVLQVKTDLELQLGNLKKELRTLQINNEQLQKEKNSLELEINNLKRENEDARRQVEYNKKVMDSISQELVREKNDKTQIQNNFKVIRNENMLLMRQLKSLGNRKINLERKLKDVQEDKESVERKYNEMEIMLKDKISYINEIKERLNDINAGKPVEAGVTPKRRAVDLPPIVVRPQSATVQSAPSSATAAVAVTGKILAINKENNFVIVDLGEGSGLKAGDDLQVYRDGNPIGSLEVIQVRKDISACDMVKETIPLQAGDIVK